MAQGKPVRSQLREILPSPEQLTLFVAVCTDAHHEETCRHRFTVDHGDSTPDEVFETAYTSVSEYIRNRHVGVPLH